MASPARIPARRYVEVLDHLEGVLDRGRKWLARPIMRAMGRLHELEKEFWDDDDGTCAGGKKQAVLTDLARCWGNHCKVLGAVAEWKALEKRIRRATKRLERFHETPSASAAASPSSSSSSSSVADTSDVTLAYLELMETPKSASLVKGMRECFLKYKGNEAFFKHLAVVMARKPAAEGVAQGDALCEWNTIEGVSLAWFHAWQKLCSALHRVFTDYFSLANHAPLVLIECLKVVEIHDTVASAASASASASASAATCSFPSSSLPSSRLPGMYGVLSEAIDGLKACRSFDASNLEAAVAAEYNLVDLCILSLGEHVMRRVRAVTGQAVHRESSPEARAAVLDALVEDLYTHLHVVNKCFPERYNMAMTMCTLYSERLASELKRVAEQIQKEDDGGGGGSRHQQLEGPDLAFSNADILGLISWMDRFVSATIVLSSQESSQDLSSEYNNSDAWLSEYKDSADAKNVKETVNGALLVQLEDFRAVYVVRARRKLREWMRTILERDCRTLAKVAMDQVRLGNCPLLSPAPVDVFSAIHSELHNVFDVVEDHELACKSVVAIGQAILEHAEQYCEATKVLYRSDNPMSKSMSQDGGAIKRVHSSPANFWKINVSASVGDPKEDDDGLNIDTGIIERLCTSANNFGLYRKETSGVANLARSKLESAILTRSKGIAVNDALAKDLAEFDTLCASAVLTFEHGSKLVIKRLVGTIVADFTNIACDLFQSAWISGESQPMARICATFIDYCNDVVRYLGPLLYTQFVTVLFFEFTASYQSVLLVSRMRISSSLGIASALTRDMDALTECARVVSSMADDSSRQKYMQESVAKSVSALVHTQALVGCRSVGDISHALSCAFEEGHFISLEFIQRLLYITKDEPRIPAEELYTTACSVEALVAKAHHVIDDWQSDFLQRTTESRHSLEEMKASSTFMRALPLLAESPLTARAQMCWRV